VTIQLGSDRLLADGRLAGHRVGVVCNPASVNGRFEHVADRIAGDPSVTLVAIFGPQHGFRADVQDNMVESPHQADTRRRVPVYSLYSETREPTPEMMEGIDLLVVDLQDVGTRIYTFVSTMANCLRAARRLGVRIIVCDRPNPIGGDAVEGPMLVEGFQSFVGQFPIPMRHGMTIGELARLFNEHFGIGADLEVVPMSGWSRRAYHDELGLPWVLPSPNIPTFDTCLVFPGAVLFEGTNVSEGRGTTRPFEILGAPWIDSEEFASRLNRLQLSGVYFRPAVFAPTFHKHAGLTCGGCQIHVTERRMFRPVQTGVAILEQCRLAGLESFAWRQTPYEYEFERLAIDLLAGSDQLRCQIESGVPAAAIAASWEPAVAEFRTLRNAFLLYS
jgi:uncharacterized protein YbbC (DUF1343 family)